MKKTLLVLFALLVIFNSNILAQVSFGTDVVSRYIWRGYDFGDAVSIQPALSYGSDDFEIGTWASYSITSSAADEHDFYASYSFGGISLGVTDYYYPSGLKFFDFDADTGAHVVEVMAGFESDDIPISFFVAANVYNDADNSIYGELTYSVGDVDFFAGFVTGESAWYGTDQFALVNVGISASKDIKITEDFTLPLFGSVIVNPDLERSYFFVGFSL